MFNNIKEHLSSHNELTKFRILKKRLFQDNDGFIWEDKNEFKLKDKLYDIVEILEDDCNDDYVFVYAINDIKEENLIKSFSNIINELISEHSNNPKIQTILLNLISQALPKTDFSLIPEKGHYLIHNFVNPILKSLSKDPLAPPPKIV